MDGLVGAATGTPTVPGLTVLDPVAADAPVAAVRAVREADGLAVWLYLAAGDLDAPTRRRLRTEIPVLIAALSDLQGVPVLPVLTHGDVGRASYLVTPRPGPTLAEELISGALPVIDVRAAMRDVADALAALHVRGLLHRGVSPATVQRRTGQNWALSPPLPVAMAELAAESGADYPFQPPEVLAGGEWSAAGEVYALAATMWAAISGRPPYGTDDRLSPLVGNEPRQITRVDVPAKLINTLRTGLSHNPADRPPLTAFVGERLETLPPTRRGAASTGRPLGSRYLLDELIGRGATGHVWRGHTRDGGDPVAVKLLRSELAEDPDVVTRFMRERATLTRLSHPHLVGVHDLVAEGDALAIVMDLIGGVDLRHLATQGRMDPALACDLMAQTSSGLAAVHAAGIVHRDMKPENVLVEDRDGRPYALLTDFGLARAAESPTLTRLTQLVGTPAYIAPELVAGREPGPPADVYALGITAYELFAGVRPFPETSTAVLLRAHLEQAPPRPDGIEDPLWWLLAACLHKEPANRPTAVQLTEAWQQMSADLRAPAPFDFSQPSRTDPTFVPWDQPDLAAPAAPHVEAHVAPYAEPHAAPHVAPYVEAHVAPYAEPHAEPQVEPHTAVYRPPPAAAYGPPPAAAHVAPPAAYPDSPARDEALDTVGARRPLIPMPTETGLHRPARRRRWPWYVLAVGVIVAGFTAGILLGPSDKKKPPGGSASKPPAAKAYPIPATITQVPGGLPIVTWTTDPKLFVAGSFVVVAVVAVAGSSGEVYPPVYPPAHTMPITDAEPGKKICFTVSAVNLKSPPPPPPSDQTCVTPK